MRQTSSQSINNGPTPKDWTPTKEEELEPLITEHQKKHGQNAVQASFSLVKAVVGAASFALPFGFMQGGLLGSVIGLFLLAILSFYTIRVLVNCKNEYNRDKQKYVTYVELCRATLGPVFAMLLYIAIVITSLGACSAYLVFCSTNLTSIVPALTQKEWTVVLVPFVLAGVLLRSYKHLAFTSVLGDVALLLGMTTVFVY